MPRTLRINGKNYFYNKDELSLERKLIGKWFLSIDLVKKNRIPYQNLTLIEGITLYSEKNRELINNENIII